MPLIHPTDQGLIYEVITEVPRRKTRNSVGKWTEDTDNSQRPFTRWTHMPPDSVIEKRIKTIQRYLVLVYRIGKNKKAGLELPFTRLWGNRHFFKKIIKFFPITPSLPLWQSLACSLYLWVCFCFVLFIHLFCFFKVPHISEIIWYLSFSDLFHIS